MRTPLTPDSESETRPGAHTTAGDKESRAFAIVVYHALRSDLARLDEDDELDERRARSMILRAVNLLPGYEAAPDDERDHLLFIHKENQSPVQLNIQDAIDSLLIVWRDFRKLTGRSTET